ncbi:probable terpene synthase 13 isoform X2 [Manihot esculenta]|uniref:Uncharacterized protein n=1 Tax=Manihot esculenta TaxID=3983 RepID=A0ACB7G978_MANES|nr:probable terpene synthase 13 isoform X2 [Manihot esculenta]KAG8635276.1 hypothetical protein MANES_16G016300v8 [Manihot esculenta]
MAFSAKATFTSSPNIPFPQDQTPKASKFFCQIEFKTALNPSKWSITHENSLPSTFSNQLIYLDDEQSSTIKDDFNMKNLQKKLRSLMHNVNKEGEDAAQGLAMVDAIQRLGIEYHFQEEIDMILQRHYMMHGTYNYNDLHEAALGFRLLRQEGYHVLAVFDKFKDREGKFKQNVDYDIKGLLGLYEASQLSIGREDHILDEAGDYSYRLLNSWVTQLDDNQARAVEKTLEYPHHKSLARFMAKHFIRDLQGGNIGWMNELQQLAKLDFTRVQSQCQQEILQISRWWKDLGLSAKLKFARNQPLKWYIWSMATLKDSNWSEQRIDLTKSISFIYLIDDIFDVHGTLDELILFTEVIKRWDISAAEQLPDYMTTCFKALDNVTNEISYKVYKQHGWNPVNSLRKAWGSLCSAFLVEGRWFASGQLPSAEEYLENGIVSSGVHVVLVHVFFLLGHGLTREAVELVNSYPPIISSSATILRLWDDLGTAKDEDQDGHDGSYIEYYMKENEGCKVENAREQVKQKISEAWKQLNKECLFRKPFSSTFTDACLNLARMVPLMYNYDHKQRLPVLECLVNSLLTETVPQ